MVWGRALLRLSMVEARHVSCSSSAWANLQGPSLFFFFLLLFFPNYFPFFLPSIFLTLSFFFFPFLLLFYSFFPFFIEDYLCTAFLLPSSQWAPSPHHPELQYLQCLVPQFLHLVTRFLVAVPQGMPFHHMSLEAGGRDLGAWVPGSQGTMTIWKVVLGQLPTQGTAQSQRYTPASLRKRPLFIQQHWPGGQAPGLEHLCWGSQEALLALDAISVLCRREFVWCSDCCDLCQGSPLHSSGLGGRQAYAWGGGRLGL